MPARTLNWTAATNTTFTTAGNWYDVDLADVALAGPASGDTLQFLDSTKSLPAGAGLPNAGEVFSLVIRDEVSTGWTKSLTDFCGTNAYVAGASGWSYSSLVVGAAEYDGELFTVDRDSVDGGTGTFWCSFYLGIDLANLVVTVKPTSLQNDSEGHTITQPMTVEPAGRASSDAGITLTLLGELALAGDFTLDASTSVLDCSVPIKITANTARIYWYGNGAPGGTIYGGLNANGYTVTHTNPTGAKLVCDQNGTLDLGADVALLDVEIAADVTLGRNLVCHTLTLTSGVLTINGFSVTYDHLVVVAGTTTENIGNYGIFVVGGDATGSMLKIGTE